MNTFFNNLVAAGATVKKCANGISVELCNHLWVFTDTQGPVDLYGDSNGGYISVPMHVKKPVVLVEKESIAWGKYKALQHTIPLDGSKYKVFC
jgi:hypothetical protein